MLISLIVNAEITDCYGVNVLAAQLKRLRDVRVQLFYIFYNFNQFYPEQTVEDLVHFCKGSDLVGLSLLSSGYQNSIQINDALKRAYDGPIVWGGKHPTIDPEDCIQHADMVALSEGEDTFYELAQRMQSGQPYKNIQGLWIRDNGDIIKNPLRSLETNLDRYLFPDYSLENKFIFDKDTHRVRPAINSDLDHLRRWYPTMITRGCPNFCTFCTNSVDKRLRQMRTRSIDNVIAEVKEFLYQHPDTQRVFFRDDCISAMPMEFITEFSERWKKEVNLPCSCSGVIATSRHFREKIEILTNGGFMNFKMGIQSGCERVRKKVFARVGETNDVIMAAANALNTHCQGKINYYMITDNPWESENELIDSIRFTSKLPRPFSLSLFSLNFYPGTALYNRAIKHQIIKNKAEALIDSIMDFQNTYLNKVFILLKHFEFPPALVHFMTRKTVFAGEKYRKIFDAIFRFLCRTDVPTRSIQRPELRKDGFSPANMIRWLAWTVARRGFKVYHRKFVTPRAGQESTSKGRDFDLPRQQAWWKR
ncbi:MAG: radical SAM protein [Desulfobacterales bacterium]|jgi:radical SAM superfamily enzyme YgiQ (UPF0313 family)